MWGFYWDKSRNRSSVAVRVVIIQVRSAGGFNLDGQLEVLEADGKLRGREKLARNPS